VNKLAQDVLAYVRKQNLLRAGDRVAVAVSGGADSVALLRLMLELRHEIGLVLSVIHLNHQLRGVESDADDAFVHELAGNHGLELISESRDVKDYAANGKLSLETAARAVRYEFFRSALERGLDRIATAHTLDDQAETLLLKLARGAGTRGLAGIWPKLAVGRQPSALSKTKASDNPSIVRPLLATRRIALREYLVEIGQAWREDASNRGLRHTRNRIRHGILPRFERHVNPQICETLAETAEISRAEEDYWDGEMGRFLAQIWRKDPQGGIVNCEALNKFPLALRRRLVREAGKFLGLDLKFKHTETILGLDGASALFLMRGWSAQRHDDEIRFRKRARSGGDYKYELSLPGRVTVAEAGIEIEAVCLRGQAKLLEHHPEPLLDFAFAQHGLVVRSWWAGEWFWPAHTKKPRKIKELLQDRHITGDEKKRWPVIASGGEVVWMRGFGVRRDFRAKGEGGVLIRETAIDGH
jgi:tRNA(Ile)-lysidine synthase